MTVDVVIVNWNGADELIGAVNSAVRFGGRAIVVDNASSGGAIEAVAAMDDVTIVRHATNRGFAAGCNSGVAVGQADIVLLLNPDAEIVAGRAADLEAIFASTDATLVGPRLEHVSGRPLRTIYGFPGTCDLLADLLRTRAIRQRLGAASPPPNRQPGDTGVPTLGWVVGAALAVRRVDWLRLGGMDEAFFVWYEDIDFGRRAARAGGVALLAPSVLVRHQGAVSWNRLTRRRRQWLRVRGARRYAARHLGPAATAVVLLAAPSALAIGVGHDIAHWLNRRP